jgi:hypothetical protein
MKLLVMQFSPSLDTSSLFDLNIVLSTLLSNTLSLCSSLNVRGQVSHPYRTRGEGEANLNRILLHEVRQCEFWALWNSSSEGNEAKNLSASLTFIPRHRLPMSSVQMVLNKLSLVT